MPFTQTVDVGDHLEVTPTALRFNEVYVKMYKLMAEFLVRLQKPLIYVNNSIH